MSEILLINPRRKRKTTKKRTTKKRTTVRRRVARKNTTPRKRRRRTLRAAAPLKRRMTRRVSTMARKRRRTTKKRVRRNPSVRRYTRKAAKSARSTFAGLNFKGALKNVIPMQLGMFGAKWVAKRFGSTANESDPSSWNARSYIQGGLGAVAVGFAAQMIKPGWGQKVLEGGLNIMFYEMIQNELVAPSEWWTNQLGGEGYYEGADEGGYEPGDVEQDDTGASYLLGEDLQWRALPSESMSGVLEPVGPLGSVLQPVGPLGGDAYAKALLDN